MSTTHAGPTRLPDRTAGAGSSTTTSGTSAPTLDHLDLTTIGEAATSAPTASPPGTEGLQAGDAVAGTWTTNVTIDALWSIDETRNAFVHVAGGAWKKVFNARDGSFQALVTLASQARQTGRPVSLREEADGMVYEIYLW